MKFTSNNISIQKLLILKAESLHVLCIIHLRNLATLDLTHWFDIFLNYLKTLSKFEVSNGFAMVGTNGGFF